MIDNLFRQLSMLDEIEESLVTFPLKERVSGPYICMTLHRPSNVDNKETLTRIMNAVSRLAEISPVIFPCHPRTKKRMEEFELDGKFTRFPQTDEIVKPGLYILEPLGYNDFLYLWKDAALVLTDSGGLQEETTALKIPCITVRENTERPITVTEGSNEIAGTDLEKIVDLGKKALCGKWKKSKIPDLWDGKAGERIAAVLADCSW
jgi:UDP-N-acetylglucosamine 2-epimerase (non-hydrolysing)